MKELKIIFMGTAELSCASLEKLAGKFSVVAVVTQPDKPKGREMKLQFSPVKILAEKLNLPVLQPAKARDEEFISELRELKLDLIVVVAYGQILPQTILDLPKFGCVNVHTSLLPKYRGASPIQSAILNGETETGVTIMKMDAGLDTGEIISQARTPILPEDNSQTLHDRLAQLGAELLVETIPDYVAGNFLPKPQPTEGASYAAKIKKEDGKIDWNEPAEKILNRLRAFTPWPGAFTFLPDSVGRTSPRADIEDSLSERLAGTLAPPKLQLLKIWKMEFVEKSGATGEVLSADKNGIVVACGKNALRILELQREGGRRLSAQEFLAGNQLKAGSKFD
ncbi:MAG TPA: methionyl-tRNA formyltransferase [Verrucomicrobiae bacterium]|nr:methionyl-tRNA formyltransferase [Verrucomicrobiae bacterium]